MSELEQEKARLAERFEKFIRTIPGNEIPMFSDVIDYIHGGRTSQHDYDELAAKYPVIRERIAAEDFMRVGV
jgi:hypothetical protein